MAQIECGDFGAEMARVEAELATAKYSAVAAGFYSLKVASSNNKQSYDDSTMHILCEGGVAPHCWIFLRLHRIETASNSDKFFTDRLEVYSTIESLMLNAMTWAKLGQTSDSVDQGHHH